MRIAEITFDRIADTLTELGLNFERAEQEGLEPRLRLGFEDKLVVEIALLGPEHDTLVVFGTILQEFDRDELIKMMQIANVWNRERVIGTVYPIPAEETTARFRIDHPMLYTQVNTAQLKDWITWVFSILNNAVQELPQMMQAEL